MSSVWRVYYTIVSSCVIPDDVLATHSRIAIDMDKVLAEEQQ